ncbi:MAG TPA: hypothetical protein PLS93_08060 [Accumulibacter sp.]|nr:hypothetical protein [Accumulibacter sp.]
MQAVELAQHGRRGRTRRGLGEAGDEDLDTGTENEGLLLVQRRTAAGSKKTGQRTKEN